MAKDYAKARSKTHTPNKALSQSFAMWFSTLMLIVLFALGLFFLSHQEKLHESKSAKNTIKKTVTIAKKKAPRFEFYDILTNDKPTITSRKIDPKTEEPSPDNIASSHNYYLQVASFRDNQDAESLKAKLTLGGYTVKIRSVTIKGKQWHRIFIGPYHNKDTALNVQDQLSSYHLDPLLVKQLPLAANGLVY